ncbi:MAG: GerMN domain-containing protein [Syntrophaceae bacterium]|nr:GerMN domain-containing protein [Syntrophaceae bacterium]
MKRKSKRKKSRIGKLLLFLVVIGLGVLTFFFFQKEIFDTLKPAVKKKEILPEKKEILLYFSDPEEEYLIGEKRRIVKKGEVGEEAKEAVKELIKGPRGKLIPTLPARTELLGLEVRRDGVGKVNFSRALSKDHPGGSSAEMMTVYSIVNSLTHNFPEIKRVQILIEGKPAETIAGHLSLRQPIPAKPDLIRRE